MNTEVTDMQSRRLETIDQLAALKGTYMQRATAPLDGMWHFGFVPQATHFGLYTGDQLTGFYCVNDDGFLLQFLVVPAHQDQASLVLDTLASSAAIKGAFASTAEPQYFVACLDTFTALEAHTLMYQLDAPSGSDAEKPGQPGPSLQDVGMDQLPEVVAFASEALGAPENWLTVYYTRTIARGEVLGVWDGARLVAIGENRAFDQFQTEYSELGVIVAENERRKGLATQVLQCLVAQNRAKGLLSICSTEMGNVGAQVAIRRAGFSAPHRIVKFTR